MTRLQYGSAPAPAFFQFDLYRDEHYALYSWDGTPEREEHVTGGWPYQVLHVARWLAHLAKHAGQSRSRAPTLDGRTRMSF